MVEWQDSILELPDRRVHYYFYQTGKSPMIFCHGFMDNGMCYDRIAETFADTHDLYLIDARGHGQSSDPPQNATYKDLIADIQAVVDFYQLHNIIIMGHSMGGAEAAFYAAEYSAEVKAVILEDPGFAPKMWKGWAKFVGFLMNMISPHKNDPGSLDKYLKRSKWMNKKWAERDQLVWAKAQQEWATHYVGLNLRILFTGALGADILPRIRVPILLLISEHGIVKPKVAKKYQAMTSNLHWEYIKGAGHNIRREQFDAEIQAINNFLNEIVQDK